MSLVRWFRDNFGGPDGLPEEVQIDLSPKPKPRLASVRHAPDRESFAAWRDQPVTQFVFAAMHHARLAQEEMWMQASWGTGKADQNALTELRARADAYAAIEEATYDAMCEWAGVEPDNG
jgi:hypothetical protein